MTIREAMEGMHISNEYDYRIGFIDENGSESETEFSVDSNSELEEIYEQFCEECGFSKDTVTYIDLVARPRVEMNIGKLKEIIKDLPDDMQVYVACDGFCNYDFDYNRPFEDTNTFGIVHDGKLFITDECAVDIGDGETLQELYQNGIVLFNGGKIIMIGFIVGLIIGILGGGTAMALCVVASDSDRKMEEIMKNIK